MVDKDIKGSKNRSFINKIMKVAVTGKGGTDGF